MKIDTKNYETAHRGKKPGGMRDAWAFHVKNGGRSEVLRFENCEYSMAVRNLRQVFKNRGGAHPDAVAEVNP